MRKSILAILFAVAIIATPAAFASDVTITATVGNEAPTVGDIQICDGGCEYSNSLLPATAFTVQVTITDPNGAGDLNLSAAKLQWYTTADDNSTAAGWDVKILSPPATGTRDGCVQAGNVYCLQVDADDWTTKFLVGAADVYVYIEDVSGSMDSNESVGGIVVGQTTGFAPDTTSGTYSGSPNSTNNPFASTQTTNAYAVTTHNGNVTLDFTGTQTDLTYQTNTIGDNNISYNTANNAGGSTPFIGEADVVQAALVRDAGSEISNTFSLYMWLDIPASQAAGAYTGTLTINSVAS